MKIGIIGGGPSGIFSAIEAKKKYSEITIFDKNDFLGRKLSATGGGRCNISNVNISPIRYRSISINCFQNLIKTFNYKYLMEYFQQLGIYTYHTDDGWVYPISNSARNISLFLENYLVQSNVNLQKSTSVKSIHKENNEFILHTDKEESYHFDKLVLASGGRAYPQLKASDAIMFSLEKFGHRIIPAHPALAPVITSKNKTKSLNGVRFDAMIRIFQDTTEIGSEFGNIIFTDWGLNGPGVMNLSHLIPGQQNLSIEIDLSKILDKNFINNTLGKKNNFQFLSTPLLPIFNKKVIDQLLFNAKFQINSPFRVKDFQMIMENLKLKENIIGTRDFEFAQISTGAIDSGNINPETLQSTLIPGLYFAGEVLDMFGPCGGYNLHWAIISGIVAGQLND